MRIQCLAPFGTLIRIPTSSAQKSLPQSDATAHLCALPATFLRRGQKGRRKNNNGFFHSKRSWRWADVVTRSLLRLPWHGPAATFLHRLSPPGVLTGAIHHGGMGPPTIQGWAINRPELSRSSPVWLFICCLPAGCLIGSLTTWFPCNLVRQYTIIALKQIPPPPLCQKINKKNPPAHLCSQQRLN